jgi:hypothetical protein
MFLTMEYIRGKRAEAEVWELSPLDYSIQQYEQKCRNYHYRKCKVPNETEQQRAERLGELRTAKVHLDLEHNRIMAMIDVEEQLVLQNYRDEYRALGSVERITYCQNEVHHPTSILEDNLRRVGRAQPSPRYSAHHIVEGVGKLRLAETKRARLKLFTHNIRINDPDNGVWMPMADKDRGHWAMPKCPPHMRIHTKNYERWVFRSIRYLNSEMELRHKLGSIRLDLKYGKQPLEVTTDEYNKKFGLVPA